MAGRYLSIQSLMAYCCGRMENNKAENNAEDGGQASEISDKAWESLKVSIRATHLAF